MNEHQPPGQAVPPLDLTDGHLQEEDAEHARGEKQFFAGPGPVAGRGAITSRRKPTPKTAVALTWT